MVDARVRVRDAADGRVDDGHPHAIGADNVGAISELIRGLGGRSDGLVQGLPGRHLRRRGLSSSGVAADLQHRPRDHRLDDWSACGALDFEFVVEDRQPPNGLRCVRLRGGLAEHLRFFHHDRSGDHAQARHRRDRAQERRANCGLTSIEPLGIELPLYDITTGTGDFIANGVVSHNCFARPTHTYLDFDAGRDFEREIVVKVNVPEVLRAELARPSWKREQVALGHQHRPVPVGREPLQADAGRSGRRCATRARRARC